MPKTAEKIASKNKTDRRYLELREKIKALMARSLKMSTEKPENVIAMLFLLGQAEDFDELSMFIEMFAPSFPELQVIGEQQKETTRESIEKRVTAAVGRIVNENPVLAVKIAKEAQRPGITWEELVSQFPELQENNNK
jgi:hypothetical protein